MTKKNEKPIHEAVPTRRELVALFPGRLAVAHPEAVAKELARLVQDRLAERARSPREGRDGGES